MPYTFNPFTGNLDYTESTQRISPLNPGTIDNMAIGLNIPREGRFTSLGADSLTLSDSGFDGFLNRLGVQSTVRIYVDSDAPASNDVVTNRGRDAFRPFRTLERAFLEVARISRTSSGVDYFSRVAVIVQPGRYLVDNRPGKSEDSITALPFFLPQDYDSYERAAELLDLNSSALSRAMFDAVDAAYDWPSDPTEAALEITKWKELLSAFLAGIIKDIRILSNESTLMNSRAHRLPNDDWGLLTSAQAPFFRLGLLQLQIQIPLVLENSGAPIPFGGNYQVIPDLPEISTEVLSFQEDIVQLALDCLEDPLVRNPWSVELERRVTPSLYQANPPRIVLGPNHQPISAAAYGKARDASRLVEINRELLIQAALSNTTLPEADWPEFLHILNKWIDCLIYDLATLSNQKCVEQARLYLTSEGDARVYPEENPIRAALKEALDDFVPVSIDIISNNLDDPLSPLELVIREGDPCSNERATFATLVSILQSPLDSEATINPWSIAVLPPVTVLGGGVVVPKGVSFVSIDLRKTEIIPTYLGEYRSYESAVEPEIDYRQWDYPQFYTWASIFKVTGGTYSYGLTYRDIPRLNWTHHKVVAFSFVNDDWEFNKTRGAYHYSKAESLIFNADSTLDLSSSSAEVEIVAPLSQAEVDSIDGASPYIYNCSLRSSYGMNGLWADGARVSGFKSIVAAQYTQVVLQRFSSAYEKWSDSLNDWIPLGSGDQYFELVPAIYESYKPYIDPVSKKPIANSIRYNPDWINFGFKVSNESFSQLVSCFCIGSARGYVSESGGDFSITNSNTNFGETAMYAEGFRPLATLTDSGFVLSHVVPPKPVLDDSIVSFKISKIDGDSLYSYWNNSGGTKRTDRVYVDSLIAEILIRPFTFKAGTKLHLRLPKTNQPSLELSVQLREVDGEVFVNEINGSTTTSYFNIEPENTFLLTSGIQLGDSVSTDPVLIEDKLEDAETLIKRVVDRRPLLDRAYHLRLTTPSGVGLSQRRRPSFGFILNSSDSSLLSSLYWVSDSRIHEGSSGQPEAYDVTLLGYEETGEPLPLTYSPYPVEDLDQEPVTDSNGLILVPDVNPTSSPTRQVVESILNTLGAEYVDPTVTEGKLSETPFEIEALSVSLQFHRPSIIRCSGHTFEYVGYLNYSQGIPEFQQLNISPEDRLYKQRKNIRGGRCFYSGLDHEGLLWAGDKATNLSTGEVFELAIQETIPEIEIPARFSTLTANSISVSGEINIGNGAVVISPAGIKGGTITDITDLAIADGGTGASDAAAARTNLGLGSISTQNADTVAITGGTISGITDLAIADGGTGASDAAAARTNLGLGSISTQNADTVAITGGTITGVPINIQSSTTFPASPAAGNLFYNASTGRLFIYYQDADSGQWVDAAPTSAGVTDIKLIDNISSQFNHSTTTFDLLSSGQPIFPVSAQQMLIVLEGIVLSPGVDYTVSGSQIVFTSAPQSNRTFSGVIYGTSVTLSTVSDNAITTAKIQNASVTPAKLNLNNHVLPAQDNLYDLGSEALRFANLYTGDLHLKNDRGDWTLIEEETYLSLRNNKTGQKFRLQMTEIKTEE